MYIFNRLILICILFLGSFFVYAEDYEYDPTDVGIKLDELTLSEYEGEVIDIRKGKVEQNVVDLTVPGNGGLDIEVRRSYQMRSQPHLATPHSIGNWALEVPKITGNVGIDMPNFCNRPDVGTISYQPPAEPVCYVDSSGFTNCTFVYPPIQTVPRTWAGLQLAIPGEQTKELLLKSSTAPAGITSKWVTNDYWKASCISTEQGPNAGFLVTSPSGTKYTFDKYTVAIPYPGVSNYLYYPAHFYPSKIEDRNGNSLNYTYIADPNNGLHVEKIEASDGRVVDFRYNNVGQVWHTKESVLLLNEIESNGQIYGFSYSGGELVGVRRPDGRSWQYDYLGAPEDEWRYNNPPAIGRVINPEGGIISYTYVGQGADYFGDTRSRREIHLLKTRVVTTGANTETFTHSYNRLEKTSGSVPGVYNITNINSSDYTKSYEFANANDWRLGLMSYHEIIDPKYGKLQSSNYIWSELPKIGDNNVRYRADSITIPRILTAKNIERDGETYTTRYLNYDSYSNPERIEEVGQEVRNRNISYDINTENWLLHQVKEVTVEGEGTINRIFDTKGNMIDEYRFGVHTHYDYYPTGDILRIIDARGNSKEFFDYVRGTAQRELHPEGVEIFRNINPTGTVAWEINGRGYKTAYQYDGLNREKYIDHPANDDEIIEYPTSTTVKRTRGQYVKSIQYDGFMRELQTEEIDSLDPSYGIIKKYVYDSLGRRSFEYYPSSIATQTVCNALSGCIRKSVPSTSSGTSTEYDALDRVRRITHPDNSFQEFKYDASLGINIEQMTNERGNVTLNTYRSYGDPDDKVLIRVDSPEGVTTVIDRNLLGQITKVAQGSRDSSGQLTQSVVRDYDYYPTKYLKSINNPETGLTAYGRDAMGNMISKTVGTSSPVIYKYDTLNRLTLTSFAGEAPDVSQTYDKNGNVERIENANAAVLYTYDENDNLITEAHEIAGLNFSIGYSHDNLDNLARVTYPSGTDIAYAPDAFGRATKVGGYINQIAYHPSGDVKRLDYANGVVSEKPQNIRLWPERTHTYKAGQEVMDYSYTYDSRGNIESVTNALNNNYNKTMTYDGLDRLTDLSGLNAQLISGTISYNAVGDILTKDIAGTSLNYQYDNNNRLANITGSRGYTFNYDAYGNIAANGTDQFTYDAAGNLTCANCSSDAVRHDYDGRNMRVHTQDSGKDSYYIYAKNNNLLWEYQLSDDKLVENIYLGSNAIAQKTVIELDSDNDGMPDIFEATYNLDPFTPDANQDPDMDGLTNLQEQSLGTNPSLTDTDGDGLDDGREVALGINPLKVDSDGDGVNDNQEVLAGRNPTVNEAVIIGIINGLLLSD